MQAWLGSAVDALVDGLGEQSAIALAGAVIGIAFGFFAQRSRFCLRSAVIARNTREGKLEGFQGGLTMRRYIAGALLRGFGGMLAGGCAVGAGISGAVVFTVTAWVTLAAVWVAASLTDALLDRPAETQRERTPEIAPGYAAP